MLEQRIDLMELQKIENDEKMESQKNMYETMLKALKNQSGDAEYEKHLKSIEKIQAKQEAEVNEIRKKYEKQLTELKQKINLQEFNEKSLKSQMKQQKSDFKQDLRQNEITIRELQMKLQQVTSEKNNTIDNLREQIEKMESKHMKEIKELQGYTDNNINYQKEDYESKLNDIKYFNEQEQLSLKSKIRKLEEELAIYREQENDFDVSMDADRMTERSQTLHIRMSEMNDKFSEDMLNTERLILDLRKEKEEADNKVESLKVQAEKLKTEMQTKLKEKDAEYHKLKTKYNEKVEAYQELEGKAKDTLRLKKKIADLKQKLTKVESIKKELKETLRERENQLETLKIEQKRAIIAEKKKARMKGEKLSKLKKDLDQKSVEVESLKRENLDQSMRNDSSFFSPMSTKRNFRFDSPTRSNFNMTDNFTDNDSILTSARRGSKMTSRRLKSSSPNRSFMSSTKRIHVGRLGRDRSARRLIQITSDDTKMFDDSQTHTHSNGLHKNCEACKYKTWRVQQLKYNPEGLLNNRDIIKYITCLGCEKAFEVKPFIKHCRDCRLSNQIPYIDGFKYWKKEDLEEDSPQESKE